MDRRNGRKNNPAVPEYDQVEISKRRNKEHIYEYIHENAGTDTTKPFDISLMTGNSDKKK